MRALRNRVVHEGGEVDRSETLVYQLRPIVEHYLRFYLHHGGTFKCLAEFVVFLDQPTARNTLRVRLQQHELALKLGIGNDDV